MPVSNKQTSNKQTLNKQTLNKQTLNKQASNVSTRKKKTTYTLGTHYAPDTNTVKGLAEMSTIKFKLQDFRGTDEPYIVVPNDLIYYACRSNKLILPVYVYSYMNRQEYNSNLVTTNIALMSSMFNNESNVCKRTINSNVEKIRDTLKAMGRPITFLADIQSYDGYKVSDKMSSLYGEGTGYTDSNRSFLQRRSNRIVDSVQNNQVVESVQDEYKKISDSHDEYKKISELQVIPALIQYKEKKDKVKDRTTLSYYFNPHKIRMNYGYTRIYLKDLMKLIDKLDGTDNYCLAMNMYFYMKMRIDVCENVGSSMLEGISTIAENNGISEHTVYKMLRILCNNLGLLKREVR